jgi:hypothetical protein
MPDFRLRARTGNHAKALASRNIQNPTMAKMKRQTSSDPPKHHLPTAAPCKGQSKLLKSRVDFERVFDSFHVPLFRILK